MTLIEYKDLLVITLVTDIALNGASRPVNARQLESRYRLGDRSLESVMQHLVRAGILKGIRGPGGGYRLAQAPGSISMGDILCAARPPGDSQDFGQSVLLNRVVSPAMAEAEKVFMQQLARITVADLTSKATTQQSIDAHERSLQTSISPQACLPPRGARSRNRVL